jgi:hypothetical protein
MLGIRCLTSLAMVILLGASSGQPSSQSLSAHRVYWNTAIGDFAMISLCANTAAMATVDGDLIRAARVLAYGQKSVAGVTEAVRNVPPDWRERVGPYLSQAALALTAAGDALRRYLAHGKVADLKSMQSDQARAASDLLAAAGEAKTSYAAMGGNPNDLETLPHAMQSANAALASAMGDTDTDDQ